MRGESGQAMIEFTLVMILLLAFIFFFVQLSLVLGWASYVQYATYLSARVLVSDQGTESEQKLRAQEQFTSMVRPGGRERVAFLARDDGQDARIGGGPEFSSQSRDFSWMEGVRYGFKSKVFLLPVGRTELPGDEKYLKLISETWLGREPSEAECISQMRPGKVIDNGC